MTTEDDTFDVLQAVGHLFVHALVIEFWFYWTHYVLHWPMYVTRSVEPVLHWPTRLRQQSESTVGGWVVVDSPLVCFAARTPHC